MLQRPEPRKETILLCQKLVMRSHLDNPTICHADNPVAVSNGGKTMGDDDHGSSLDDVAHVFLDDALAFIVEGTRRLVEDEERRVGGERPCDGYALPLPPPTGWRPVPR